MIVVRRQAGEANDDGSLGDPGGEVMAAGGGSVGAGGCGGSGGLDDAGSEGAGASTVVDSASFGCQSSQMMDAFSDTRRALIPDQAGREAVKDNLLSRKPWVFMMQGEELHARRDSWLPAGE